MSPSKDSTIDSSVRKKVLRLIPYGIYVITCQHESEVSASTIDWVTQASFDPPMVVCCLRKDSFIYNLVKKSGTYLIHPLSEGQKDLASSFFKHKEATDTHINGNAYSISPNGNPVLNDGASYFELKFVSELDQSDHRVVLGELIGVEMKVERPPLLLKSTGWNYGG